LIKDDSIMSGTKSRYRIFIAALIVVSIFLAAIPTVSAYTVATVTDPATSLHSGDAITVTVTGLAVGNTFKYRLYSNDLDTPGDTVITNSVTLPFEFNPNPATSLSTTGYTLPKDPLTLSYNGGAAYIPGIAAGTNPITLNKNINAGTYDVSLQGTKISGAVTTIDYSVDGTIATVPAGDQTLSFTLKNVNTGHITIDIPNAIPAYTQQYTITLPPTPEPAPAPGDGGPSAPAAPAAPAAPQAMLAPPGVSPTTVTMQHNPEGQVLANYVVETDPAAGFSSALDVGLGTTVLSSTGQPVGELSLTPLDPAVVTDVAAAQGGIFSFSGLSVECEPSGTQFTGGAVTISFSLTPAQWADALGKVNGNTQAMTIQFYDLTTKTWAEIPTTVDPVTHTVSAQVTHFSVYALFYKPTTEGVTSPQTYGNLMPPTPTSMMPAGTPIPTVKSMLAPPAPTETPGLPGIVVIGVVGFVGLFIARKKQ
jgi:hypothetical protein